MTPRSSPLRPSRTNLSASTVLAWLPWRTANALPAPSMVAKAPPISPPSRATATTDHGFPSFIFTSLIPDLTSLLHLPPHRQAGDRMLTFFRREKGPGKEFVLANGRILPKRHRLLFFVFHHLATLKIRV